MITGKSNMIVLNDILNTYNKWYTEVKKMENLIVHLKKYSEYSATK